GPQLFTYTALGNGKKNISRGTAGASGSFYPRTNFSQPNRFAHLVHSEFSSSQHYVQQRSGATTGRQRQHRYELHRKPRELPSGNEKLGAGECESRSLRSRGKYR